jgi:Predicted acetyltransferase
MNEIVYKSEKNLDPAKLGNLFLSVEWSSGNYPEKLAIAMKNSGSVFTAWNGNELVGLINALDDGVMTAYIHYMLVNPDYQKRGIGKELVRLVTEKYGEYLRIVLIAYDKEVDFYAKIGFVAANDKTPMFITSLWT